MSTVYVVKSQGVYLLRPGRWEYPNAPKNRLQLWTADIAEAKRWATREAAERNAAAATTYNGRGERILAEVIAIKG